MDNSRSACFPKSARLRKRGEFVRLASTPYKTTVKGFLVVWAVNTTLSTRLGITASRKVGCAVIRNRIKRYLREYFRHNYHGLGSLDINIIARRDAAQMSYPDVVRELGSAFQRIGVSSCSRAACSL